jgi:hypothetical protein
VRNTHFAPNGNPTGRVIRACQTAFVTATQNNFGRVFVMGGWIPQTAYVIVSPDYGQPGGQPIAPQCVGK